MGQTNTTEKVYRGVPIKHLGMGPGQPEFWICADKLKNKKRSYGYLASDGTIRDTCRGCWYETVEDAIRAIDLYFQLNPAEMPPHKNQFSLPAGYYYFHGS